VPAVAVRRHRMLRRFVITWEVIGARLRVVPVGAHVRCSCSERAPEYRKSKQRTSSSIATIPELPGTPRYAPLPTHSRGRHTFGWTPSGPYHQLQDFAVCSNAFVFPHAQHAHVDVEPLSHASRPSCEREDVLG
jgi:hypothetical protein